MQHFYRVTIEEEWALTALEFRENGSDNASQETEEANGDES